ncbi:formate dehydrogenase, cytochrome b556(fdo) subunit [mine drainage metagenome]|uniref:Formate dehydrogenase, cytochrome b556(Fdo) subunit n=1 Tax=mine drainage metagenome TaxID=410659 RepID=A0A1J5Q3D2_9ZZZZ
MSRSMSFLMASLFAAAVLMAPPAAQAAGATPAAPPSAGQAAPPGAATLPGYLKQNNAERGQVQPGNNAPMWRELKQQSGFSSLPYPEAGVLIQPQTAYPGSAFTSAGEAWRQTRNRLLVPVGGWLLIVAVAGIALFYVVRGKIILEHEPAGRKIERFTPFERFMHWTLAFSFVALAVSGIVMMFGKFFLLPVIGASLFGWLTYGLKTIHNFVGPIFGLSLVIVLLTFIRDNLPRKQDLAWLARGGGLFGGAEAPSARFNAGEKLWFWVGVLVCGLVATGSGLVLDRLVPGFDYTRGAMQVAEILHASATVLLMAMAFGHIYIGTIGTEGALDGMRTGYVDESWAKQHHALWLGDIKAGKIPARRSGTGTQAPLPVARPKA